MKYDKTLQELCKAYQRKEYSISSAVTDILSFKQKNLITFIIGYLQGIKFILQFI